MIAAHYGKTCLCRVGQIHGKASSEHGKALAVWRNTAKSTRRKTARQRIFAVCLSARNTAKALPCAFHPGARQKYSWRNLHLTDGATSDGFCRVHQTREHGKYLNIRRVPTIQDHGKIFSLPCATPWDEHGEEKAPAHPFPYFAVCHRLGNTTKILPLCRVPPTTEHGKGRLAWPNGRSGCTGCCHVWSLPCSCTRQRSLPCICTRQRAHPVFFLIVSF
jgi:hypothetical protein